MHSKTLIPNSIPPTTTTTTTTTTTDHDHDHDSDTNALNSISTINDHHDQNSQIHDDFDHANDDDEDNEIALHVDQPDAGAGDASDNNPPDSFWVSNNKVTDWLDNHTYIERKASVKLVPVSRKFDPTSQTRSNPRSVSFNQKPQATIIGFRQKPPADGKSKQSDQRQENARFFKNRSLPGKSFFQQVAEPRSPRVSCIGRVGSMRGRAIRVGFWKTVKMAVLNKVRRKELKDGGGVGGVTTAKNEC